ncbi:MAG: TRAP transporter substrate-binding protein [Thermodesulfobacteriota bacterium]
MGKISGFYIECTYLQSGGVSMKGYRFRVVSVILALACMILFLEEIAFAQKQIRIPYNTSELSPQHFQANKFASEVNNRLPNQFSFRFYPNSQMGSETNVLEGLQLGTMEMSIIVSAAINVDRKLGIFDLPWLFKNRQQARSIMTGPLKVKILQFLEQKSGTKVLGIYDHGFRHVISRRVIEKPEDMKGLKIRVAGGKIRQELFRKLGANPTPVDWAEVFTALQTKVVDGAEAAIYGLYEAKLYQVCPHLSLTSHNYTTTFLVASKALWNQLSPQQQKVFDEIGGSLTNWSYDSVEQTENEYLKEMRKQAKINEVNIEAFRAASSTVIDDYVKTYGNDWIKEINAAR